MGHLSERIGRRRSIMLAMSISLLSIPVWAFGASFLALAAGAFIMQFGVQGAFGVIPAHLNELSPPSVRSLFPGVVYQLGTLISAPSVGLEYALRRPLGYGGAMAAFEAATIVALFLICGLGPERKDRDLSAS